MELWERQEGETPAQYKAFSIYRDLDGRSIDKAYRVLKGDTEGTKKAPTRWKEWSVKNEWVDRVATYDDYLDGLNREQDEADKLQARKERKQIIRNLKAISGEAIKRTYEKFNKDTTKNLTMTELIRLVSLILTEERAEYDDMPAQRHELTGPDGGPIKIDPIVDKTLKQVYGDNSNDGT